MKNILILTGRYKPNMSANSICVDNTIKELPSSAIRYKNDWYEV